MGVVPYRLYSDGVSSARWRLDPPASKPSAIRYGRVIQSSDAQSRVRTIYAGEQTASKLKSDYVRDMGQFITNPLQMLQYQGTRAEPAGSGGDDDDTTSSVEDERSGPRRGGRQRKQGTLPAHGDGTGEGDGGRGKGGGGRDSPDSGQSDPLTSPTLGRTPGHSGHTNPYGILHESSDEEEDGDEASSETKTKPASREPSGVRPGQALSGQRGLSPRKRSTKQQPSAVSPRLTPPVPAPRSRQKRSKTPATRPIPTVQQASHFIPGFFRSAIVGRRRQGQGQGQGQGQKGATGYRHVCRR